MEEGILTHSNILAWRIPWTENPGGLQSSPQDCKELDATEATYHARISDGEVLWIPSAPLLALN